MCKFAGVYMCAGVFVCLLVCWCICVCVSSFVCVLMCLFLVCVFVSGDCFTFCIPESLDCKFRNASRGN